MNIVPTLVLSLALVILNSSELSSQSESSSRPGSTLDDPLTGDSGSPEMFPPPMTTRSRSPRAGHCSPEKASSSLSYRITRCMNPPARLPSDHGPGYTLDHLPYIRLTTRTGSGRTFELRRFTFSADTGLLLREDQSHYVPVPNQEQIVLTTSGGDIFAILESPNTLAGICIRNMRARYPTRAKINMESGTVTPLTINEMKEIPVGCYHHIRRHFRIKRLKQE